MILLQLVDSTGGQGTPNGIDGPQMDEAAPTGLSITKTHTLAFTANAPDAEGYRVFQSIAGAPATLILTTKASGVALPKVAPCVAVAYALAGFHNGVGWQSDPIGPVSVMAPPSRHAGLHRCPTGHAGRDRSSRRSCMRSRRRSGMSASASWPTAWAHATVVLSRKGKKLVTAVKPLGGDAP